MSKVRGDGGGLRVKDTNLTEMGIMRQSLRGLPSGGLCGGVSILFEDTLTARKQVSGRVRGGGEMWGKPWRAEETHHLPGLTSCLLPRHPQECDAVVLRMRKGKSGSFFSTALRGCVCFKDIKMALLGVWS